MKLIVDSYLKIDKSESLAQRLKAECFVPNPEYVNNAKMGFSTEGIPRLEPIFQEVGNQLWLPRALVNRYVDKAVEIVDNTVLGDEVDFKCHVQLREKPENQVEFYDKFFPAIRDSYGASGQAGCGYGKTILALKAIADLKRTAIVVVHKTFLVDQWIERIKFCYDIKDSEIGFVVGDKVDWEGKKIVIALVQSLLAKDLPESFYDYFGTFGLDEEHRFGAPTFRQIIVKFKARYRLGVTATPNRKDDLQEVFFKHIGEIKAIGEARKIKAEVNMLQSKCIIASERPFMDYRKKVNLTKVVSFLVDSDTRNRQITTIIMNAIKADRKVLLLSDRREHLKTLYDMLNLSMKKEQVRKTVGFYVGGMEQMDLDISATRDVLLATYQMAQEGLDIPELDTLILATPKGDIEQAVGRILRVCDGKKKPVVVDLVDNVSICLGLARKRKLQYKTLGYTLK